jgi:hypothetical protein
VLIVRKLRGRQMTRAAELCRLNNLGAPAYEQSPMMTWCASKLELIKSWTSNLPMRFLVQIAQPSLCRQVVDSAVPSFPVVRALRVQAAADGLPFRRAGSREHADEDWAVH